MLKSLFVLYTFLFLSACSEKEVNSLDSEPPKISIVGNSTLSLVQGESYSDAGATAKDNVDITVLVKTDNSVNTKVVGIYTVTYTAIDNANNEATPIIRTVKIIPKVSVIVAQGMKSLISLRPTDVMPLKGFTFEIVSDPTIGTVELQADQSFVSYTSRNTVGEDTFDFKVTDINNRSYVATVSIKIIATKIELNNVELHNFSSNLPIVIIDTLKNIPDDPKIKGLLTIIPINPLTGKSSLNDQPEYAGFMEIEIRGSSSMKFPKKQYGVDTVNLDGDDNDVSLLGMPKEHKWILHAPYSDKSLMRNYLAYKKTRDMGGYTAVRSKYVEVLKRQNDGVYRYEGVYVFMEKIKRDKSRVNIKKLKPSKTEEPDISGGYIIRQGREKEDWFFFTKKGSKIILEYPKTKNINREQKIYIETYMNSFESALYSKNFNDSTHRNYYGNYINIDSFVKHLLSREFFRDADTWLVSEFFNKERAGKLSMSPVWDFNLGMGNNNNIISATTAGWHFNRNTIGNIRINVGIAGIMRRLMSDHEFKNKVAITWHKQRVNKWSDANLELFIDNTKSLLRESQERNFQRWPVLGKYIWPNRKNVCKGSEYCDTWDKAVDEDLKAWLFARASWMDRNLSH